MLRLVNDYGGDSTGVWQQENAKAEIGIPVQPLDYLAKACELVHPDLMKVKLSAELEAAVLKQNTALGLELRRERIAWTKDVLELARTCAGKELELSTKRSWEEVCNHARSP